MSSLQYGEVSLVLIPFYGQGNRLREVRLPVQVYASSNLGLSDSDPRMFLTTVLCQTPTIYQICSIFKMTELFWICVRLFYSLTFKELFFASLSKEPFIQNRTRITRDYQALAWKTKDESPGQGYEERAGSQPSAGSPVATEPVQEAEVGGAAMPHWDQGIFPPPGLHDNN